MAEPQFELSAQLAQFLTFFELEGRTAAFMDAQTSTVVFENGSVLVQHPTAGGMWLGPGYEVQLEADPDDRNLLGVLILEGAIRQGLPWRVVQYENPESLAEARALS